MILFFFILAFLGLAYAVVIWNRNHYDIPENVNANSVSQYQDGHFFVQKLFKGNTIVAVMVERPGVDFALLAKRPDSVHSESMQFFKVHPGKEEKTTAITFKVIRYNSEYLIKAMQRKMNIWADSPGTMYEDARPDKRYYLQGDSVILTQPLK